MTLISLASNRIIQVAASASQLQGCVRGLSDSEYGDSIAGLNEFQVRRKRARPTTSAILKNHLRCISYSRYAFFYFFREILESYSNKPRIERYSPLVAHSYSYEFQRDPLFYPLFLLSEALSTSQSSLGFLIGFISRLGSR